MKQIIELLLGRRAALLYLAGFAIAVGVATFVENDFGTDTAQKVIYKATWFETLLFLFAASLVYNINAFKMIQRRRWTVLTFHLAMIIILLGSAFTRFFGYEGTMHIREGSSSNTFLSRETHLGFQFEVGGQTYSVDREVLFATLGTNQYEEVFEIEDHTIEVSLLEFMANPVVELRESDRGKPTLKVVFGGANGRSEYYLSPGDRRMIQGVPFDFSGFNSDQTFSLRWAGDSLSFRTDVPVIERVMATGSIDTLNPGTWHPLHLRALYRSSYGAFVFGDFMPSGQMNYASGDSKLLNSSKVALRMSVTIDGNTDELLVTGQKGFEGSYARTRLGDVGTAIRYGSEPVEVPFALELLDFEMTRYPGTNSPESFASEVVIHDEELGVHEPFRIYMNHILDYRGFRFFQSSYDRDEMGTYLSVNHDSLGTWTSYLGYALLTLGMLLTLFSKNTRFGELRQRITRLRSKESATAILLLFSIGVAMGQTPSIAEIDADHARGFSELIVQDVRGRMKPMHTLSREILRKVHGSETWEGRTADQVVLSQWADPNAWYGIPFIKLGKSEPLRNLLGVDGERAAYRDFFDAEGSYKLSEEVTQANLKEATEKGVYEKSLISVDERVNIMNMVFSGMLFRLVPIPDHPGQHWSSAGRHGSEHPSEMAQRFFSAYREALRTSAREGQFNDADLLIQDLDRYQHEVGGELLPSEAKRNAEIKLNEWKPFNKLSVIYLMLGLVFLTLLFTQVFRERPMNSRAIRVVTTLLILAFAFHTVGLAMRWYVSGRAPWSNGYESMIYIAWTSTLAGVLFARKSAGALAATNILASVVLLIAMLSYLNPEITPLVPVLKSYWLTIHVSLEAGSYGFLMLGAIIGLINLLLIVTSSKKRWKRTRLKVEELSAISEITITAGLFMLSIGTYLGGVWANESWGRYWGWDAKETWALVSILVYAVILHMRFIPALRNLFAFNVGTLVGLASVIMTYYGVNYYLSGLHSYAAGDPVPIPQWVYVAVISLAALGTAAYIRWRGLRLRRDS